MQQPPAINGNALVQSVCDRGTYGRSFKLQMYSCLHSPGVDPSIPLHTGKYYM
eukprot:SAG31_NODE_15129_length_769_cov_0.849254_1_plen_52_part_01